MTHAKIDRLLDQYAKKLRGYEPARIDPNRHIDMNGEPLWPILSHAQHMIGYMKAWNFDAARTEKLMRWLGFLQGALWLAGLYSLNELMEHNKPEVSE